MTQQAVEKTKEVRNYKKMVTDINKLVENDWAFEMIDCKALKNTPYTAKESKQVRKVLGKIYSISHRIHCDACLGEYRIKAPITNHLEEKV